VIEKTPRDLSLYSNSVLTILDTVLRSKDVNMVEESLTTFEAYCKHVDPAALTADQHRSQQYITLVELYASFANSDQKDRSRSGESVPMAIRWRTAGLRGIRAAVSSDALSADSAKQLNFVIPTILDNMSLETLPVLASLQSRVRTSEKQDADMARRRRMSNATVTTVDTVDNHQLQATETTADADKAAEEEVRVLALRCLKQIFSAGISTNRGQTRLATALVLKFIATKNAPRTPLTGPQSGNWATSLFETISRWTPVQDRFIIVVTAMETLVRSPIIEAVLEKQLILATMIDWLLSSDINLIGLSVMDVLLGLVHHTLLLLQLGGRDSKITPHHQQNDTLGLARETKEIFDPSTILVEPDRGRPITSTETAPSQVRQELLLRLQKCIASLSNHIYYTDQISDMMAAILSRLKPSPSSDIPTTAAAIENPVAATRTIAETANLQEDPTTDNFFSFATARVAALKAVKDILIRANNRRTSSGSSIEARARVGVQVWDGTQWLLKDEDTEVRLAYVDALLTWLRLETNRSDMLLPRDGPRKNKPNKKATANGDAELAKRAVSNASKRELKPARSTFLQLLHLAIYDSILDRCNEERAILVFYLLLTKLVERLGVNALRTGLPMVLKLQEAALYGAGDSSITAKINVASLIHGYLWTVAEKFEFEGLKVGHEINAEISRRKRFGIWFEKIKFPGISLDQIKLQTVLSEKEAAYVEDAVGTLKPYLNVTELVDEIATSYDNSLLTPPTSPPGSPGRVFSVPTLGFGYGYGVAAGPKPSPKDQMPEKVKDEMGSSWTREACIAAVEKESAGSMTGTSSGPRHHLSVHSANKNDADKANLGNGVAQGNGLLSGLQKSRKGSVNGSPLVLTATSSRESTLRVTELKRALVAFNGSGRQASPLRKPKSGSRRSTISVGTDSMVSWNGPDEQDVNQENSPGKKTSRPATAASKRGQTESTSAQPEGNHHEPNVERLGEDVPPVPKIPSSLNLPGTYPRDGSPSRAAASSSNHEKLERMPSRTEEQPPGSSPPSKRVPSASYAGSSIRNNRLREPKGASRPSSRASGGRALWNERRDVSEKLDMNNLLAGIRSSSDGGSSFATNSLGNEPEVNVRVRLSQPPY
jgi:protein EFR3